MTPSSLEVYRAEPLLHALCRRRNLSATAGSHWYVSRRGIEFVICARLPGAAGSGNVPLVRLCFENDGWSLCVPAADGGWRAYGPQPTLARIEAVIAALEQAPLHVHWG